MDKNFRVLVIDEWLPLPLNIGKKIRTMNLLKQLAKRYSIDIICFADNQKEKDYIYELKKLGINVIPIQDKRPKRNSLMFFLSLFFNQFSSFPFSVSYNYDQDFQCKLAEIIKKYRYDLLHFEWTQVASYLRKLQTNLPVVISAHNIESMIWERYSRNARNIVAKLFYFLQMKKMYKFEKWAYNKADFVTAVSEADAKIIKEEYGQKKVLLVSNGVDIHYFKNNNSNIRNNEILFFGAMDYKPNIDAVIFFLENVMPLLVNKLTNVRFLVVGRNPAKRLKNIEKNHSYVEVVGTVDDMRPFYKKDSIFVVPLKSGGGTRLKILEAMAMEMPIVSTRIGAESLHYENGVNIMIADTPEQFCNKIYELYEKPQLKEKLGRAARDLVENQYCWEKIAIIQNNLWRTMIKNNKANF